MLSLCLLSFEWENPALLGYDMDTKTFYHNRQFGIKIRGKDTLLKAKRLPCLTSKTIHVSLADLP